jgi:ribosome-associated translation inhibitor RaiA
MQIQVNSDKTVSVDASLTRFVKSETERILDSVAAKLTRVEVHLSDVNGRKSGPADKRCLVEARPAGARPLSTSATATRLDTAIGQALRKMQRALRSFFGRQGRTSTASGAPVSRTEKAPTVSPRSSSATKPVAADATTRTTGRTKTKVSTAARSSAATKAKSAAAALPERDRQSHSGTAAKSRGQKK